MTVKLPKGWKPECCHECGKEMIATSEEFLSCPDMHGKLRSKPLDYSKYLKLYKRKQWLAQLPTALPTGERCGLKLAFMIEGRDGIFVLDGRGYACLMETDGVAILRDKPRRFICAQSHLRKSKGVSDE